MEARRRGAAFPVRPYICVSPWPSAGRTRTPAPRLRSCARPGLGTEHCLRCAAHTPQLHPPCQAPRGGRIEARRRGAAFPVPPYATSLRLCTTRVGVKLLNFHLSCDAPIENVLHGTRVVRCGRSSISHRDACARLTSGALVFIASHSQGTQCTPICDIPATLYDARWREAAQPSPLL